jgi:hypothetical protein
VSMTGSSVPPAIGRGVPLRARVMVANSSRMSLGPGSDLRPLLKIPARGGVCPSIPPLGRCLVPGSEVAVEESPWVICHAGNCVYIYTISIYNLYIYMCKVYMLFNLYIMQCMYAIYIYIHSKISIYLIYIYSIYNTL